MNSESLLSGWWVFAGILLLVAGLLNIIWGIAAIGDSKFFTEEATYILSGLHTWGWIMLIVGVLELVAAFSLWSGRRVRALVRHLHRLAQRDRRRCSRSAPTRSGRWPCSRSRSSSSTSSPRGPRTPREHVLRLRSSVDAERAAALRPTSCGELEGVRRVVRQPDEAPAADAIVFVADVEPAAADRLVEAIDELGIAGRRLRADQARRGRAAAPPPRRRRRHRRLRLGRGGGPGAGQLAAAGPLPGADQRRRGDRRARRDHRAARS